MKLLPRFSLRFAWIALTIFLIAFGIGVNSWRRKQQHDENVEQLLAGDFAIEAIEESWGGYLPENRVVGLIPSWGCKDEQLQAFLDLARPADLQRLALNHPQLSPEMQDKFFAKLAQCTSLEQLHLKGMNLEETQAESLKSLVKLRILDLQDTRLPAGCQSFLRKLNQLEILVLDSQGFSMDELETLDMPQLRVLKLRNFFSREVRLTRAGFGRFPLLESLTFEQSDFESVLCEAGAMPQLENLGIPPSAHHCSIGWPVLPDAAPRLKGLAVHATQFGFAIRDEMLRMTNLQRLYFEDVPAHPTDRISRAIHLGALVNYRTGFKPELEEFLAARPQIRFDANYSNFLLNINPPELTFSVQGISGTKPRWASKHWIAQSLYSHPPANSPLNSPRNGISSVARTPPYPPPNLRNSIQPLLEKFSAARENDSNSSPSDPPIGARDPFAPAPSQDPFAPPPADPFAPPAADPLAK